MPGYIYLIMMADGVYKVGRTEQEYGTHLKRLKSYPADSQIVFVRKTQDAAVNVESDILEMFKNEFGKHPRGKEYFTGDENRMIELINQATNMKPATRLDKHPLKKYIQSGNLVLDPSRYCPLIVFSSEFKIWCRNRLKGQYKFNENFYSDVFSHFNAEVRHDSRLWGGGKWENQEFVFGIDLNPVVD